MTLYKHSGQKESERLNLPACYYSETFYTRQNMQINHHINLSMLPSSLPINSNCSLHDVHKKQQCKDSEQFYKPDDGQFKVCVLCIFLIMKS